MKKYILLLFLLLSGCIFVDESPNRCYHLLDPSQKDSCLLMVATETNNISKCDEINQTSIAEQCYSMLLMNGTAANSSTCEKMSGVNRDDCFSNLAIAENDSSICMNVNYSYERDNCISKISIAHENPSMCEPISIDASRDLCKNQIFEMLAVTNKDPSFCKLLVSENGSNQDLVDRCIFDLAQSLNDTSYCDQISNEFSKEICLTGKIDPATCEEIADPMGQEACLYIAATYSNDQSSCQTLPSQSMKDNCYMQIAKNTKDVSVCASISSDDLRSQCDQIVNS
jgi:hypothetical protein